jgi:hypothetical protein
MAASVLHKIVASRFAFLEAIAYCRYGEFERFVDMAATGLAF